MSAKTKAPATLQVSCVQLHWAKPMPRNLERALHYIGEAAATGSRVVVFPKANLTSYDLAHAQTLTRAPILAALKRVCAAAKQKHIWVIVGTLQPTSDRLLNLAHVISPDGRIVHEYAKTHMAGHGEMEACRPGKKLSLFEIDGIPCTLAICRDGRHPEVYRIPGMAGAQIFFHPSCSSDDLEAVWWKRVAGRAQHPIAPHTRMFHCVANTIGQDPAGKQSSSGNSFIRDPTGLPLAEAGWYQEEMITAVLDLPRADRYYVLDSITHPPYLQQYWEQMIAAVKAHANDPCE